MKRKLAECVMILLAVGLVFTGCQTVQENPIGDNTPQVTPAQKTATATRQATATVTASTATVPPSATTTNDTATAGATTETATSATPNTTAPVQITSSVTAKPTATPTPTAIPKPTVSPVDQSLFSQNKTNQWVEYTQVTNITKGVSWPAGQALPIYATPADNLDTVSVSTLSADEQITFSALQGIVNKKQPRIYLLDNNPDEGATTWAKTVGFTNRTSYNTKTKRYQLIAKYANELKGVVLYSTENSVHYRNLACTVAGLMNAIPVTQNIYHQLTSAGVELKILVNLTTLTYTSEVDIYNYLYDNYWKNCTKRLIVSAKPSNDGDLNHTRDIAASVGAAVVYLDCTKSAQKNVYEKFLKDMADSDSSSVVLGWYTTERSGITTATKYGIGTVPADLYISGTVYGGTDHTIQVPSVPTKDAVENKVYIAVYISDGDNIQYNQRYMRKLWDQSASSRGKVAMNWTISPALVDVGPALMNYYYTNATDYECFVCGPSGMGYAMPVNTLKETGASTGSFLKDSTYLKNYTQLSGTYFERAGLRVVTVWDNLTSTQREAYERNSRYLYGVTVQDFGGIGGVSPSTVKQLHFEKQTMCYTSSYNDLYHSMCENIEHWNGASPIFLSYQVSVWGDVKPAEIYKLYQALNEKYAGKFEFVRADHYFALYNEANNLDYNLCMDSSTKVTANTSSKTVNLRDGSAATLWTSNSKTNQYVQFDLGEVHTVSRYVIRFAGANGMDAAYNVRAYRVQVSTDGTNWTTVDTYKENIQNTVDIEMTSVKARYVRIVIDNGAGDGYARIADVEIYGK